MRNKEERGKKKTKQQTTTQQTQQQGVGKETQKYKGRIQLLYLFHFDQFKRYKGLYENHGV